MMVNARTFIVHAVNSEQENVLKAFFNALSIKFEITEDKPYDKDFVEMVLQAEDCIMKGKGE